MADACEGTFQLLEDVMVEEVGADAVKLLSVSPATPGEVVSVEVPREEGQGNAVFRGSVTDSRPVMTDGTLRHRVVVTLDGAPQTEEETRS